MARNCAIAGFGSWLLRYYLRSDYQTSGAKQEQNDFGRQHNRAIDKVNLFA
jgi:hypothetical protein